MTPVSTGRKPSAGDSGHLGKLKFSKSMTYAFSEYGATMAASVLNSKSQNVYCKSVCEIKADDCRTSRTKQALRNLEAILKNADSDKNHVLKVTVYISDIALWDRVNSVYAKFFEDHRPARSIVPTRDLHFGYQIEIDDAISAVIKNGA